MNNKIFKLVFAAMFTALCCVATMMIRIPTVGTNGYVNIGDTIVLLSAWMLGGVYGMAAAGLGSAMADLLAGYTQYVPGTFVIKFLMALVAIMVFNFMTKLVKVKFVSYIVSGVLAETVMVVGYFLYESTLLGYGLAAASSIPGNMIQGVTCLVLGVVAINALEGVKEFKGYISKTN